MIKKAFSLAELLIVLAIIGVLTGLCLGAGRVSLQNAYNLYYYRTFNAITIGFHDYLYRNLHINPNQDEGVYTGTNPAGLCAHLGRLGLNATDSGLNLDADIALKCDVYETSPGNVDPNFILLKVTVPKIKTLGDKEDDDDRTKDTYQIIYTTGFKTKADDDGKYQPNYRAPIMILVGNNKTNIIDNPNILPVFLDTGVVGRRLNNASSLDETISPISYRTAFCLSADLSSPNAALRGYGSFYDGYCKAVGVPAGTPDTPLPKFVGVPIKLLKPRGMR